MNKLIRLISVSTLLLCLACGDTETVYEQLAGDCAGQVDQRVLLSLRGELDSLEAYFVKEGLLHDKSGTGIYRVYQQIARDGDLLFAVKKKFPLLDSIPPQVLSRCYPLALETPTVSPNLLRYLRTAYEMKALSSEGNITPGKVAQEIVNNLKPEDFDQGFLRVSALITFYIVATPASLLPICAPQPPDSLQWTVLSLSADDVLRYDDQVIALDQLSPRLRTFVEVNPQRRGVRMDTRRETSYEFYISVYDSVKQMYQALRKQKAQDLYQRPLKELSESERKTVEEKVPLYVSVAEPED